MTTAFSYKTILISAIKQQWKLLFFVLFFLPVLLSLGFWQLDRAEQKRELLAVYQQQKNLPALSLKNAAKNSDIPYQKVIVEGQYNNKQYWLLDNRSREGKAGYEVVMPFWDGQQWLLVNRGWVMAPTKRNELPVLEARWQVEQLQGYLHPPPENAIIKSMLSDWSEPWPQRVLHINMAQVEEQLGAPVFPKVLRIEYDSPSAFFAYWPVVNTLPEKHTGYAVQWFAMATVLLMLYGWVIKKSINKKNRL